jgi:hypothetical protein
MSNEEKYKALMAKYKANRTKDPEAVKYLKAAMKLRSEGGISEETVLGSAYL